ncbi:hypothetical protein AXK57_19650 [Tsukamurella pulmonis]|uniref:hypothetical protein n=1 Tax=Tsukamurella pulmonis TaxID=47312 RepID=UPI000792FB7F|nr:hypothetical protein [Tsukamurella pulmonis]KXP12496.1 hypothetical protein AXK57_19650 [Tsukamurella pulmonis]
MTRFVTKDPAAAARAASQLPAAARAVGARLQLAAQALTTLEATATPTEVLAAVARARRVQARADEALGELLLLLVDAGASARSIAAQTGMHHSAVRNRVEAARVAREVAAAEAGTA